VDHFGTESAISCFHAPGCRANTPHITHIQHGQTFNLGAKLIQSSIQISLLAFYIQQGLADCGYLIPQLFFYPLQPGTLALRIGIAPNQPTDRASEMICHPGSRSRFHAAVLCIRDIMARPSKKPSRNAGRFTLFQSAFKTGPAWT
jgi:hypothetical protein